MILQTKIGCNKRNIVTEQYYNQIILKLNYRKQHINQKKQY